MRVVELPAVVVEERGPLAQRQPVGVRHDRLEVRQRLAVRARPRRLARGRRALGEQRVDVARLGRVVQQPRALGPSARAQRRDHGLVEQPPPQRRQALLDRPPRELVAEPEPVAARSSISPASSASGQRVAALAEQHRGQLGRDRATGTTDSRSSASRQSGLEQPHAAPAPRP